MNSTLRNDESELFTQLRILYSQYEALDTLARAAWINNNPATRRINEHERTVIFNDIIVLLKQEVYKHEKQGQQ